MRDGQRLDGRLLALPQRSDEFAGQDFERVAILRGVGRPPRGQAIDIGGKLRFVGHDLRGSFPAQSVRERPASQRVATRAKLRGAA